MVCVPVGRRLRAVASVLAIILLPTALAGCLTTDAAEFADAAQKLAVTPIERGNRGAGPEPQRVAQAVALTRVELGYSALGERGRDVETGCNFRRQSSRPLENCLSQAQD